MLTNLDITDVSPIVKPEIVYTLGFIWADGCVYVWKDRNSQMIKITIISEDMEKLKITFDKSFYWKYSIEKSTNVNWKEKTNAILYRRGLCNFLIEHDYKSKFNSACKILSKIPVNLKHYWFRGLIDGDGCFYISKNKKSAHLGIYSEYKQDWTFLENLFKSMNIKYNIYRTKRNHGSSSEIRISSIENIVKFGDWVYQDYDNIGLSRKYNKYTIIKNEILPNMWKPKSKHKKIGFLKKRNHWYFKYTDLNGKLKHVGGFITEQDAYLAQQSIN